MQLYSQHDPSYDRLKIGSSTLTIHGYGCFLCSLGTLFQKHPTEIMKIPNAITPDGLVVAGVIAKACGGDYTGQFQNGFGWQIAQTDHYAAQGYPTHFFCVNMQTKQQIDPLKFPAVVEPLSYHVVNVRVFTGTKLDTSVAIPVGPFPDVAPDRWSCGAIQFCKDNGLLKGYDDGTFKPEKQVTREELAVVIQRLKA